MTAHSIRKFILSRLRRSLAASLLLSLIALGVYAQRSSTDGSTPTGMAPGSPSGSYSLSGFESINYFNGSLNFSLPLLSVKGRGGAGVPVMLNLEQHWRMEEFYFEGTNYHYALPQWWNPEIPTFNPGYMMARHVGNGSRSCYPYCGTDTGCTFGSTLTRLTFTAPDGTEHEFRDQLTDGKPIQPGCADTVGPNRGKVFVTNDSSSMVFISDADIRDNLSYNSTEGVSGYLKMSDGSVFRIEGAVKSIRDRNGNTITFEYGIGLDPARIAESPDYQGIILTKITDSLNREVTFDYNVADPQRGLCNKITFKGFGGAPRTISISYADLQNSLRADQSIKTYRQLFPSVNGNSSGPNDPDTLFNPKKPTAVYLPNGQSYQFQYTSYGELAHVTLPTGGWIEYDYDAGVRFIDTGYARPYHYNDLDLYRRVVTRRDSAGGTVAISQPESEEVVFGSPGVSHITSEGHVDVQQYDQGQPIVLTKHYYYGSPTASIEAADVDAFYNSSWKDGREWKTETYDRDTSNLLHRVEQHWEQRTHSAWAISAGYDDHNEPINDPRVYETITTLADVTPNKVTRETFTFDPDPSIKYNSLTDTYLYDYGSGSPGTQLLHHTHTDYLTYRTLNNGVDYTGNDIHILNLPAQQSTFGLNSSGQEVEKTRAIYEYDNYTTGANHATLLSYPLISGMNAAFTSSYQTRGNVTGTTQYLLNSSGVVTDSLSSYAQYDIAGNAVKAIDARGYSALIDYSDNFGVPDGEARANSIPTTLGSQVSYAFPAKVTNALGHIIYAQFDYNTGQTVNTEDVNGVVSSVNNCSGIDNCDQLDRPRLMIRDVGNLAGKSSTVIDYDDANHVITSRSDLNNYDDGLLKSQSVYDALGRTIETRSYETATSYITTRQEYDALGRVKRSTNPYRDGETVYWTTSVYDSLARVIKVTTPDGAEVNTYYNGAQVLVKDQAGKERMSQANALGQLKDVWEITAADDATEPISFPNRSEVVAGYRTTYDYDTQGNLITVTQRKGANGTAQTRSFAYDSLSRLTSATIPESGTTTYQYDANGNLKRKTDARNIAIVYEYDELNRVTSRTSQNDNGATPPVYYKYDSQSLPTGAPTFDRGSATGRLVAVLYGGQASTTGTYQGYDALGRVARSIQRTNDGQADQTYSFPNYVYNLAGGLTSQTYPSGRVVTTGYDNAGRLNQVSGQKTGETGKTYTSDFSYSAHGAVTELKLGNNLWEHTIFNSRLQPVLVGLGTAQSIPNPQDINRFRVDYSYGSTNNNGNVQQQTVSVPDTAGNYVAAMAQVYTYDELNRLKAAQENGGTSWKQTFVYDRYGNRSFDAAQTTMPSPLQNPGINNANDNRINAGQGYGYDVAGNLTSAPNQTFNYDAENRQVSYNGGNPISGGGIFSYDGNGRRVRKIAESGTTIFVYDAAGQLVAEYASNPPPQGGGTSYLTSDNLGTPRVITGADGSVKARHDYFPFGEELVAGVGGRTTDQGYSQFDGNRKKWATYERDYETGLDYAQARYYSSTQGRFTSPDPLLASARPASPKTWNRYAYCGNNPLIYVDPSGLDWWYDSGAKEATPVWYDKDPGGKWKRWTDIAGYVYQPSYQPGVWIALDPNRRAGLMTNSREKAQAAEDSFTGSGIGLSMTHAQQDFWAGVGAGLGGPTSWFLGKIAGAGGVDTTSRDYRVGLLFGGAGFGAVIGAGNIGSSLATEGAEGQVFQRVMSNAELEATQATGLLRGGREGANFFTNAASLDAKRAQIRLGLDGPLRDVRMTFRITDSSAVVGPQRAAAGMTGTPGGGKEFFTNGPTQVDVLRVDQLRK
jgi:RHS repeat-associated protein